MHYRSEDAKDWNVLALAEPAELGPAMRVLRELGRFRVTTFPGVMVGLCDAPERLIPDVLGNEELHELLRDNLGRLVPTAGARVFERDDVTEAICEAMDEDPGLPRAGSYYVRARLRGMKGRLEHQAVERALGSFLYQRGQEQGTGNEVSFTDPDWMVSVEVVGQRVAYGVLDSKARTSPLFRIR